MLACNCPSERRFWMLTRSCHWFEMVKTVFTDKEWYDNVRVSKETFQNIVSEIEDEIVRKDTAMRKAISSRKNWFGTVNRLHYTFRPSRAEFLGTRTNFTRARTTYPAGPSTGEILARHGWGKVVYTTNFIRTEPLFLVRVPFLSEPCQNFSVV